MEELIAWLVNLSGMNPLLVERLLKSFLIVFFLWLIRTITIRIVWRQTENPQSRYRWQKSSVYIVVIFGIILIGRVWFAGVQSLATYLGLLSAGIAIALKDLIVSVAGWIFLIWRRPFSVGDRIQIGQHTGDVIDLRLFKFTLLEIGNWVDADQSTGRIMHLSNSMVLTEPIANYSKGFQYIWNEIPVLITFESNWKKAKDVLRDVGSKHGEHFSDAAEKRLKEASKKFMIFYSTLTLTVYTTVKDCGVMLTIRYLIDPRQRRSSEQSIWEEILDAFAACNDIDFAYPTQRFFDNALEGKEGTRPGQNK